MSYSLLSPRSVETAHADIWTDRTVAAELEVLDGRTLVDDMRRWIKPQSDVIEAGCGLGGWVRLLTNDGHRVVGLDFEPEVVATVRSDDPELDVRQGDVTAIDFEDESFDAYVSLGVVEHFQDGPSLALREAFRVLRPGGVAIITVPYLNTFRRFISHPVRDLYFLLQRARGNSGEFWEYRYTRKEMVDFVGAAGFEVAEVGLDDFRADATDRHLGLWADFFFLRDRSAPGYRLNRAGRAIRRLLTKVPGATSAGVLIVGVKR